MVRKFFLFAVGAALLFGFLSSSASASARRPASQEKKAHRVVVAYNSEHVKNYIGLQKFVSILKARASVRLLPVSRANAHSEVRLIYLVPSDKQAQEKYRKAIEKAGRHLQIWYRMQLGNISTFNLHDPVVEVYGTMHPSSWYKDHATGSESKYWFWENVLHDAFALTQGKFNDSRNRWIYYIEADPACGQVGGAGTSGVAILPANDLRGLTGEERVQICPADYPDTTGVCRWIGGLGHELGHALELPHPAECESGSASCPSSSLMWLGYLSYPNTYLTASDKNKLEYSRFISDSFVSDTLPACGS